MAGPFFEPVLESIPEEEELILNSSRGSNILSSPSGPFARLDKLVDDLVTLPQKADWGASPLAPEAPVGKFDVFVQERVEPLPTVRGAPDGFKGYDTPSGEANLSFEREQQGLRWVREGDQWHQYTKEADGIWVRSAAIEAHTSPTVDAADNPILDDSFFDRLTNEIQQDRHIDLKDLANSKINQLVMEHSLDGRDANALREYVYNVAKDVHDRLYGQVEQVSAHDITHELTARESAHSEPHSPVPTLNPTEDMPHVQTLNRTEDVTSSPLTASAGTSTEPALTVSAGTNTEPALTVSKETSTDAPLTTSAGTNTDHTLTTSTGTSTDHARVASAETQTGASGMSHIQTLSRTEDMPNAPLTASTSTGSNADHTFIASTGPSADHARVASAETHTEASGGSSKGALLGVLAVGTPVVAAGAAAAGAYLGTHSNGSDDKADPALKQPADLLPHAPAPLHTDDQAHHQVPHDIGPVS
ncbi:hypothetical protein [Rhodoligotrophos defluvii]|uniref:hypothetical protein n=1 Tax=Rhodoligotrophos defluvii TaxID=2561934 RepID=UPI0010C9A73B|nr:hypothetical protein [Rhodoligotrophos defluvii]